MGRLEGKAGIVVGGGQTAGETLGNGRASALVFAREGAKILVADRDLASAEETVSLIAKEGGTARAHRADWTRADDCEGFAQACLRLWGRIDFLQNNVGIFAGDKPIDAIAEADYQRILDVNLKGCMLSCRAALPAMRAQRKGSIVNISSFAAHGASKNVAYKLSKAGVNALGQVLALEYAPHGIRVNTIAPGMMDTPMAYQGRGLAGEQRERFKDTRDRSVPLGKMGTAWDTAYASLFLHSDEAGHITGVVLPVDGGLSVRIG